MSQSIVVHITDSGDVFFLEGEERASNLLEIGGTPYATDDQGKRVQLEKRDGRIVTIRHDDTRPVVEG